MKKMMKYIFVILCALCFLLPAEAADRSENREKGYFDNTRTVILLPVRFTNSSGNYAAAYLQKEMKQVFRYPYYREMEYADYSESNITPEELSDIQIETGADIVVMPAVPRCLGIPQATDRLPKILQAGTQFRDCPHQSVQEVSGIAEARPPAAGCIYPGSGHIPAGNALLPVQPAAHRSLCASGMHGLHYPEP